MADEKEKKERKKVKYNNQEYDENLIAFVNQYAEEYTRYRHMNQAQREDFMHTLQQRLGLMSNGQDGYDSEAPNRDKTYTGQITDNRKSGPRAYNGMKRNEFNASREVNDYLAGMAGRLQAVQNQYDALYSSSSSKPKATKKWSAYGSGNASSTLAKLIYNEMGNSPTGWADAVGDVQTDGVRGITNRRNKIREVLLKYAAELGKGTDGDYGELNEDKQQELDRINAILEATKEGIQQDPVKVDALYKRLLGDTVYNNLFFTGEKILTDEEQAKADEEKKKEEALQKHEDFVTGKTDESPYDENGSEQERAAAEEAKRQRKEYEDAQLYRQFEAQDYDYDPTTDVPTFRTSVVNFDPEKAHLYQTYDPNELLGYIKNAERLNTDANGYDRHDLFYLGQVGHDDYQGYGKDDTPLSRDYFGDYFNMIGEEPDNVTNGNAKTNAAWLGQYALNILYNRMATSAGGLASYRIRGGNNKGQYLLPELVDWNTGKAYTVELKGGKATLHTANIKYIMQSLSEANKELKEQLYQLWKTYHQANIPAQANGGIIYAKAGRPLYDEEVEALRRSYAREGAPQQEETVQQEEEDPNQLYYEEGTKRGTQGQKRWEAGQVKPSQEGWTNSDIIRLASAGADIASGLAAFVPGYGTAAAAVLGVGSTLGNLGADWADESLSGWDVAKNLGMNLGLDVVGLIPGISMEASFGKAIKSIASWGPKILVLFSMHNLPDAGKAAAKILDGQSLSVKEWQDLATGISVVAGMSRLGNAAYRRRQIKNKATKGTDEMLGNKKKSEVSKQDIEAVKKAETKEKYESEYERVFGVKPEEGGFRRRRDGLLGRVTRYRNNETPKSKSVTVTDEAALQALHQQNTERIQRHPLLSRVLNTDYDMFTQQTGAIRNPVRNPRNPNQPKPFTPPRREVTPEPTPRPTPEPTPRMTKKEEKELMKAAQKVLKDQGQKKIRNKKEFLRYVREKLKDKDLKQQTEAIQNLTAEDLVNLRTSYKFAQGGMVPKAGWGDKLKTLFEEHPNAIMTGAELYKNYMSRKATNESADMIKSTPALQYDYKDLQSGLTSVNAGQAYDNQAAKTMSIGTNLSNQYATGERQLAGKLATLNQFNTLSEKGALANREQYNTNMTNQQQINNANISGHSEVDNKNLQLMNSKLASDMGIDAQANRFNVSQNEKLINVAEIGYRNSAKQRWNAARTKAIQSEPLYLQYQQDIDIAHKAYNVVKANYEKDPITHKAAYEDAKQRWENAQKTFDDFVKRWNETYILNNPEPDVAPFALNTSAGITPPFQTNESPYVVTSQKSGGSIGKMTQAELVKLFRDQEKRKYKDRESQRKYLDKYSERVHRGNQAIAYQAYIKLLNSK